MVVLRGYRQVTIYLPYKKFIKHPCYVLLRVCDNDESSQYILWAMYTGTKTYAAVQTLLYFIEKSWRASFPLSYHAGKVTLRIPVARVLGLRRTFGGWLQSHNRNLYSSLRYHNINQIKTNKSGRGTLHAWERKITWTICRKTSTEEMLGRSRRRRRIIKCTLLK